MDFGRTEIKKEICSGFNHKISRICGGKELYINRIG